MKKPHYLLPDIIRFTCLSIIILIHLGLPFFPNIQLHIPFLENFFELSLVSYAVGGYFFVSGFVNELSHKQESFRRFMFKKVLDIYPVYWVCLALSIILFSLHFAPGVYPLQDPSITGFLCSTIGFCAYIGKWGGPYLSVSWYIGILMTLYLLYPLISKLMNSYGHLRVTFLLTAFSLLVRYFLVKNQIGDPPHTLQWHPLAHLFEFTLGVYFAKCLKPRMLIPVKKQKNKLLLQYLNKLNLPLYLIHVPLESIFTSLRDLHYSYFTSIIIYMIITVVISRIILNVSAPITRYLGKFIPAV